MALASSTVRQRRTFQPAKIFAAGKEQTTNRNELERIELEEKKAKDKENAERDFLKEIAEFKKIYQDSAVKVVKKRGNVWGEGVIKEDWDQEN